MAEEPIQLYKRVWTKLRHGLLVQEVLSVFCKMGIKIWPYYVVREGLNIEPPDFGKRFEPYNVGFLKAEDMKEIVAIPGRRASEGKLIQQL